MIGPMNLDPDTCYAALCSRDARFDGRFFTAVRSTGVFCRPVCPALTPKRANCTFVASAAAAIEMGYRPCLRCRPETAPGSPAWRGTSSTVARALRLIEDGALDTGSVEDLAARLGLGARQLRRLFIDQVGAAPKTVAQTRRLLLAKKLIGETALPLTEIAFASGFASQRRFNDAFVRLYGRPPRALRRGDAAMPEAALLQGAPEVTLRLPFRPPYDWPGVIGLLTNDAVAGMEVATADGYARTIRMGSTLGILSVRPDQGGRHLLTGFRLSSTDGLAGCVARTRRLFDLDADPEAIAARLKSDRLLAATVAARPGIRIPGSWDVFELAVRAVLSQRVSVAAARTFTRRLVAACGAPLPRALVTDGLHLTFPDPLAVATTDLVAAGIHSGRIEILKRLADLFIEGRIASDGRTRPEEIHERLLAIQGIGPWTANLVAMRALGDPDAFPAGDLGLLRAARRRTRRKISPRQLEKRAETWRPWRAYAAVYLWASLGQQE